MALQWDLRSPEDRGGGGLKEAGGAAVSPQERGADRGGACAAGRRASLRVARVLGLRLWADGTLSVTLPQAGYEFTLGPMNFKGPSQRRVSMEERRAGGLTQRRATGDPDAL